MIEIRIHGRGGQGSVVAAELIAEAAFEEGKWSQAFPSFGPERRGAPVTAFARIDEKVIRSVERVYNPDYVIVQDATLLSSVDVTQGLKRGGMVIVNASKSADELGLRGNVRTINATKIAMEIIGRPIVNTTMLGAFSAFTGVIGVESLIKVVKNRFGGKVGEANAKAVERAYEVCRQSSG